MGNREMLPSPIISNKLLFFVYHDKKDVQRNCVLLSKTPFHNLPSYIKLIVNQVEVIILIVSDLPNLIFFILTHFHFIIILK